MIQMTQLAFDALPSIDGRKQCPGNTDYSLIKVFGERCSFGERCRFGEWCSFGEWCCFLSRGIFAPHATDRFYDGGGA